LGGRLGGTQGSEDTLVEAASAEAVAELAEDDLAEKCESVNAVEAVAESEESTRAPKEKKKKSVTVHPRA
jgi:predicted dinucleotide-utilizing enzyme